MFFRIVALSQLQLHGWLPSMQFRLWKLSKHRLLPSIWLQSYTLRQQTMGSIDPIHTCQPWRPGSCGKDVAGRADLGRKVPCCWRCGMMWNKRRKWCRPWEKRVGRRIFYVTFTSKTKPPFNSATSGGLKKGTPVQSSNFAGILLVTCIFGSNADARDRVCR